MIKNNIMKIIIFVTINQKPDYNYKKLDIFLTIY